jgi:peptidoglycan/xylan/chitin deacetylase (PgdA/CDA1 family)
MIFAAGIFCISIVLFLMLRFSILLPPVKGLPVLLYHKMSASAEDSLTIRPQTFERQLLYLREKGYQTISMRQLLAFLETGSPLPKKPVMITFDDGYVNNGELAYPLLKKHGCRAVFFIPSGGIGKTSFWDANAEPLMSGAQLKSLDPAVVEFGFHSADHRNYKDLAPDQIDADVRKNISVLKGLGVPFVPAFAYPYGGRPNDRAIYECMVESFSRAGIKLAFRIGNRVNRLPLKNPFEVKRISIRGTDSMWIFETKLTKGRVKQV